MNVMNPQFFTTTTAAWEAMLAACASARTSIDMEQYIFTPDTIGKRFLDLFIQKSKEGVKIRLICDTVGSYYFFNSPIPSQLRKLGIEIRFFNIISSWRIPNMFSWYFRDHRKILIVDGTTGLTGGVGIRETMQSWRDTHIQVTGSVVEEMEETFNEMWDIAAERNIFARIKKSRLYLRRAHFITNAPYPRRRFLYHQLIDAMRDAQKYIYLTTPYFVPDRRVMRVLRLAVHRGVDVRIILPKMSDAPIVHRAAHSFFSELLSYGIRIYEYDHSFIHAKTAVIDDQWATVGSFNFDSFSFTYNHEANIVDTDAAFVATLKGHFEKDLDISQEVLKDEWEKRPFIWKLREFLIKPIRQFL